MLAELPCNFGSRRPMQLTAMLVDACGAYKRPLAHKTICVSTISW